MTYQQAGFRAAEVLVRTLISSFVPGGQLISGVLEALAAARDALPQQQKQASDREIIAMIRALPDKEYERIVDEELTAKAGLTTAQVLEIRRQLMDLPGSFADMLTSAKREEVRDREERIAVLYVRMRAAWNEKRWAEANRSARALMRLGVREKELTEIEKFSYARHLNPVRVIYLLQVAGFTVFVAVGMTQNMPSSHQVNGIVLLVAGMLVLSWAATSKRMTVRARLVFKVLSFAYLIGCLVYAVSFATSAF